MIAFKYNVFYNNSLVCMKFKTAGFPSMIFKNQTYVLKYYTHCVMLCGMLLIAEI